MLVNLVVFEWSSLGILREKSQRQSTLGLKITLGMMSYYGMAP